MTDERLFERLAAHAGPADVDSGFEDRLYLHLQQEMGRSRRSARLVLLLAAALAAILAISAAVAVGSGLVKLPAILPAPSPSAAADPCGYARDIALDGKTIYALAYTNVDGVDGYSATGCDVLIAALVENSGDSSAGAGDLVLYGRHPTEFDAPYSFVAFSRTSSEATSVLCHSQEVLSLAPVGSAEPFARWWGTSAYPALDELTVNVDGTELLLQDWFEPPDPNEVGPDRIDGNARSDLADNAFLNIDLFTVGAATTAHPERCGNTP